MKQFATIEKLDTGILYAFALASNHQCHDCEEMAQPCTGGGCTDHITAYRKETGER